MPLYCRLAESKRVQPPLPLFSLVSRYPKAFSPLPLISGLYHFNASFRPVPLEMQFIGVSVNNFMARNTMMAEICYGKVWDRGGAGFTPYRVHTSPSQGPPLHTVL